MADRGESSASRWRLILGRYAQKWLQADLSDEELRMARALDYLYSREYEGRGARMDGRDRHGSLDPSQLTIPSWLSEVRELFPRQTVETIEKHALDRYGLTELVTDPEVLSRLEPSTDLLKMLLTFRNQLQGRVLEEARRLIRKVVDEITERLRTSVRNAMIGRINRQQHSPLRVAQNFDARGTIRRNLKNYNPDLGRIIVDNPRFFSRVKRQLPWQVILCVDQSGSMLDSVIYSAVMAGILAGLPMLTVKLVVFDTSVVDLSGYVDDPVEVLMSVQLGGGTDIGQALRYCEQLVDNPRRTVVVLVSDFYEGASPRRLITTVRRLREAGVKLIGLAALDENARANYDRQLAETLAGVGMDIAALTPEQLAKWLAKVMY